MNLLDTITLLSHEFGTTEYVKGGGGNTSAKDTQTLWVKPSGTTLAGMAPDRFVVMNRAKIDQLYEVEAPQDPTGREALVKEMMQAAVKPDSTGRPSVEAPLHNTFSAAYVVHTHPALVNGMTCGHDGQKACGELFPDALWMDFVDPGYTLCIHVRQEIQNYVARHGKEPSLVFLKNHGVFVAGDSPEEIRRHYERILKALGAWYKKAGVATELSIGPAPSAQVVDSVTAQLRQSLQTGEAAFVKTSGAFPIAEGPLSPDHIVYAKAYPLVGETSAEALNRFRTNHGYAPRVVATENAVFGIGDSDKNAGLALEFAQDGALVAQLAQAFGGTELMTDRARDFIENWEVEAYRRKAIQE
ncbi:class II aldolase/adducin family protein [bacterium]|nr:class II aldolase/adducin family protein [bacterium]